MPSRLLRLLLQLGSLERKPIGYPCNLVWSPTLFASQSPARRNPTQGSLLVTRKVVEIERIQAELVQVITHDSWMTALIYLLSYSGIVSLRNSYLPKTHKTYHNKAWNFEYQFLEQTKQRCCSNDACARRSIRGCVTVPHHLLVYE